MVYVSRRIVYAKKLHNLIEKRFSHRFCGVQIERLLKFRMLSQSFSPYYGSTAIVKIAIVIKKSIIFLPHKAQ